MKRLAMAAACAALALTPACAQSSEETDPSQTGAPATETNAEANAEANGEANTADAATLTLTVSGIENHRGHLMIAVFSSEANWDGDGEPVAATRLAVEGAEETAVFAGLTPGQYAIRLYHDVNDDGELGTNPFGIPNEPFAFSNNARGMMGPASYEDAAFAVEAGENAHGMSLQ